MPTTSPALVSVLVRSMDRTTLARALDSIAAQDYPNIEVVVVAASGTTHRDLPQTCGPFPLRLVRPQNPLGRAEAANAALDAAHGEWLNLLDDDDAFLPDHISTLRTELTENVNSRLAYARSVSIVDSAGSRTEFGSAFKPWRQLDTGFFHSQAAMFARSLVTEGARFDPQFDILEDMDFFVQCAQRTTFKFVERITSISYRDAGTSGTGTQRDELRMKSAIARLRAKWSTLEQQLRCMPEFRLEKAMWLLDHDDIEAAGMELRSVLAEKPDWPDALAFSALLRARAR
jgi:hypothetical protein